LCQQVFYYIKMQSWEFEKEWAKKMSFYLPLKQQKEQKIVQTKYGHTCDTQNFRYLMNNLGV
jgi:hypothetical protein